MSKRAPSLVIKDILYCIDHILLYTNALSFKDFTSNFMATEAWLYNIQVIGEAVAKQNNCALSQSELLARGHSGKFPLPSIADRDLYPVATE
jgi:uncharacterized protein with HEPN domain